MTTTARLCLLIAACALGMGVFQLRAEDARPLAAQDRAEIQQLAVNYGKALGTCAAEDYARLFEPDGVFASGPRGTVSGRAALIALVESATATAPASAWHGRHRPWRSRRSRAARRPRECSGRTAATSTTPT
jgi:hypothetical protein